MTDHHDIPVLAIELRSDDDTIEERVVQLNDAVVVFKITPKKQEDEDEGTANQGLR